MPWHVTRFFPVQDLAHLPPTPLSTLKRAREIGREEGLDFVYIGNVPGAPEQDTLSPDCEEGAVRCSRLTAPEGRLRGGCCPGCGRAIPWNRPAANHPASRPA